MLAFGASSIVAAVGQTDWQVMSGVRPRPMNQRVGRLLPNETRRVAHDQIERLFVDVAEFAVEKTVYAPRALSSRGRV